MKKFIFFFFFGALFLGVHAQIGSVTSWQLVGNSVADGYFLGATNCKPLIFKTRNVERMWLSASESSLGIGTQYPQATLHLHYQKDKSPCNIIIDGHDEDSTSTRGIVRNLLWLTTPETGTNEEVFVVYGNGTVNAKYIYAEEIKVTLNAIGSYPDYVFAKDYNLRPLSELEQFIKENHHLPEIPTEAEVQENGINLGDMQSKLLLKIEELTLYTIEQQKLIEALERRLSELENKKGGE